MIKVCIIDDSPLARKLIGEMLESDPEIKVVAKALNGIFGLRHVIHDKPDVVTLDFEMPQMNGMETLRRIMAQRPTPVIMVSSHTPEGGDLTLEALSTGAVDFVAKPSTKDSDGLQILKDELIRKVKIAARVHLAPAPASAAAALPPLPEPVILAVPPPQKKEPSVPQKTVEGKGPQFKDLEFIAIGASTGGVPALQMILAKMPANCPPILIVQHMPEGFTASFAQRLDKLSAIEVREAKDGDEALPGLALLAPGNNHIGLRAQGKKLFAYLEQSSPVSGHRPSVDFMFGTVAKNAPAGTLGIILTGMGSDGAIGMKEMHLRGMHTVAQSEETCVVYGMPRVAVEKGGVDKIIPLAEIPDYIVKLISQKK